MLSFCSKKLTPAELEVEKEIQRKKMKLRENSFNVFPPKSLKNDQTILNYHKDPLKKFCSSNISHAEKLKKEEHSKIFHNENRITKELNEGNHCSLKKHHSITLVTSSSDSDLENSNSPVDGVSQVFSKPKSNQLDFHQKQMTKKNQNKLDFFSLKNTNIAEKQRHSSNIVNNFHPGDLILLKNYLEVTYIGKSQNMLITLNHGVLQWVNSEQLLN